MQLDVQAAIPEREKKPHRRQLVNSCQDEFFPISGMGEVRIHRQKYRMPVCETGIEAGRSQRGMLCGIVRHITADDNHNQRVQIAKDRIVETTLLEARIGERDLVPEPARRSDSRSELPSRHLRVPLVQVRAVQEAVPVRIPAAGKPRLCHRYRLIVCNQDSSKRQKVCHGLDMALERLVLETERDRHQRYSD